MAKSPLLSIIVPVYNVEKYLSQCLESLINQTYKNIEIICVNDGSPDNSLEILEKYRNKDNRVIIINQKNGGLSSARNKGLKFANGEFLMFVDSDDWIDLDTCELAINAINDNSADLVLWSYIREYDNKSLPKLMFWDDYQVFDSEQVKNLINRRLCGLIGSELSHPDYANAIETAWGKLYRRSIIAENKVEFVSEKEIGTEDALFNIHITRHVSKAVYLKKPLNHYRRDNVSSLTTCYKDKLYIQWLRLFDLIKEYIDINSLGDDFYLALNNRVALSVIGLGINIIHSKFTTKEKCAMIRSIITSKRYREAYRTLNFKYFPLHWKTFFFFAKNRCSYGLYFLLRLIVRAIS